MYRSIIWTLPTWVEASNPAQQNPLLNRTPYEFLGFLGVLLTATATELHKIHNTFCNHLHQKMDMNILSIYIRQRYLHQKLLDHLLKSQLLLFWMVSLTVRPKKVQRINQTENNPFLSHFFLTAFLSFCSIFFTQISWVSVRISYRYHHRSGYKLCFLGKNLLNIKDSKTKSIIC